MYKTVFRVNSKNEVDGIKVDLKANTVKGSNFMQQKKQAYNLLKYLVQKKYKQNMLEVSTSSEYIYGKQASAFNLLYTTQQGKKYPVENVFQSSKYFEKDGNKLELLTVSPKQAKQGVSRIQRKQKIIKFSFAGQDYPNVPRTLFYNWIYCKALYQNKNILNWVLEYNIFSDINYTHGINSQAQACAVVVALNNKYLLDEAMLNIENFKKYVYGEILK